MNEPKTEHPKPFTHDEAIALIKQMHHAEIVEPYAAAIRMVREAVEELFGPVASLESPDAVLLRGPEPHHDAEAIIGALQRVKFKLDRAERYKRPYHET